MIFHHFLLFYEAILVELVLCKCSNCLINTYTGVYIFCYPPLKVVGRYWTKSDFLNFYYINLGKKLKGGGGNEIQIGWKIYTPEHTHIYYTFCYSMKQMKVGILIIEYFFKRLFNNFFSFTRPFLVDQNVFCLDSIS